MSKKNKEDIIMESMHILDAIKNCGGEQPTMRGLAEVVGCAPTKLYSLGKKPIPGQVYDPNVTNWDAISAYVETKLVVDPEVEGCHTMEDAVKAALEVDAYNKEHGTRRGTGGSNLIEVDGEMIPKRKSAMFEMGNENESFVCFKKDANVYKIVYQTESYTTVRPVTAEGEFASNELKTVSNLTLNTKCVAPAQMTEAINARFSGAYAEQSTETENASQE